MSSSLAVNGGVPVVAAGAVSPWPHITDADREAVGEVLAGESLGEARLLQSESLAAEWAEYVGARYCVPANSGTAALHMGIVALDIGPGDEVIVPAFTFWASAAAVLHHNAIPVFVDIEPQTWCIDPARIEEKISERTKAIMVVHIHGVAADMDPIVELADRYGLKIIEDAAQAHGATYKGRQCGKLGDVAAFSTQMSKALTAGSEGGLFVTDNEDHYRKAALLQYFGELVAPGRERAEQQYDALGLGWMYRGDVFGHAFTRSQLRRLDEYNAHRVRNCAYLTEQLQRVEGIETPVVPPERESIYYNYVVGFRPDQLGLDLTPRELRERAQHALNAEGVAAGQWQLLSVPGQRIFQTKLGYGHGCPWECRTPTRAPSNVEYHPDDYPQANAFLDSHCYLFDINAPNGLDIMELYVEAIKKVLANADQLPPPPPQAMKQIMAQRTPVEYVAGYTMLGD